MCPSGRSNTQQLPMHELADHCQPLKDRTGAVALISSVLPQQRLLDDPERAAAGHVVVDGPRRRPAASQVQKQVREFEPKIAVFSGREGMEIYKRLIPQAHEHLRPGGWFVTEIGYSEEEKVCSLLAAWQDVQVTADLQGIPRVVTARKPQTID